MLDIRWLLTIWVYSVDLKAFWHQSFGKCFTGQRCHVESHIVTQSFIYTISRLARGFSMTEYTIVLRASAPRHFQICV